MISCLLLTADRRRFVPGAIERFLLQDYPDRELIVLDDGVSSAVDLIPRDERIRYFRLDRRLSVGAKRNLGCRHARGEYIAHWDDDDWMAPWRLSYQVAELERFGADLCGLRQVYFWGPDAGQAWEYVYEADAKPWVAGGTMLYRRSLWEAAPFPDANVGEDNAFVWSGVEKRVLPLVDRRFYVAAIHPGNTSPKVITPDRWRPAPIDEIQQVVGNDWNTWGAVVFGSEAETQVPEPLVESQTPVSAFTFARQEHLRLREFEAFNYGRELPPMRRWELPFAIFQARLPETAAVLDCSANPAGLERWIGELYPHVLYRYSAPIVDGRSLGPVLAPDASFDRVFCLNTLEHLPSVQREQLVSMMASALKPGGLLVATCDHYFDSSWQHPDWLATGLMRADGAEVFNGFNKVTPRGLSEVFERHGLQPLAEVPGEAGAPLFVSDPPLQHAVFGAVFSKGTLAPVASRCIILALLTWNTRAISMESFETHVREARMLRRLGHDARVCVVDNGSADGTPAELQSRAASLDVPHRLILNPENYGNSRARNQMIDYATECGADYLLFVDGDIELVPFSAFTMLRYMESQGSRVGCFGAYSFLCTPDRDKTTPFLPSLANCRVDASDALAWTQYGLFRCRMFAEGLRFEESGPFGEPGHGLEDVDLAFQMNRLGYLNLYFTGMTYLHRNLSSSVGLLSERGLEPTDAYYRRREFVLRKWEGVSQIAEGPLRWVRSAQAPWSEIRTGRTGQVRLAPAAPSIEVPGEIVDWVDRSVSDMMDRTELLALAAVLAIFDWRLSDLIVEIGAYIGTTTVLMARITERLGHRTTVLSIDPFERCQPDQLNPQGRYTEFRENLRTAGVEDRCLVLSAFSAEAARTVPDAIGVLVIDGSHHYEAVRADLELYIPKVVPGGYIFLDDYGPAYPDVIRAVDEYLAAHPAIEIVVRSYYVILRQPSSSTTQSSMRPADRRLA